MIYKNSLYFCLLLSHVCLFLSATTYEHAESISCHFFLPLPSGGQEPSTLLIFSAASPFAPPDPNEGIIDGGILDDGRIVLTTANGPLTIAELKNDFILDINLKEIIEDPITSLALMENPPRAFVTTNFKSYILPVNEYFSNMSRIIIDESISTAPGLIRVIPQENLLLAQIKNGSFLLVGEIDPTKQHTYRKKSKIVDVAESKNGCLYTFGENDAVLMHKENELNVLVLADTPLCFVEGNVFKKCAYVFDSSGSIKRVAFLPKFNKNLSCSEVPIAYEDEHIWDNYVSIRLLGKITHSRPKLRKKNQEMLDIFKNLLLDLEQDPDFLIPSQILASITFQNTTIFTNFSEHHDPYKIRRVMFFDSWILFWEGPKLSIWKKKKCRKKYNILDGYELLDKLRNKKNTANNGCIIL